MRTISAKQQEALEDLSAQGLLRQLPLQTAEKDIHVTDLLEKLSLLKVYHDMFGDLGRHEKTRHDDGIQLIFAGGTCLSKAHGLINRMSEDIDIKVVLSPTTHPLSKGRGDRARLKALHKVIPELVSEVGLGLKEYSEKENPWIRDSHRHYVVGAAYKSAYTQLPSLRPELKLELVERPPFLKPEVKSFGYLYEELSGIPRSKALTFQCINVGETAAEKVLSMLRRCAYKWDGYQKGEMDPTLVRHIYDVTAIAEKSPASIDAAKTIFKLLVDKDAVEFKGLNPKFDAAPVSTLRRTLTDAKSNPELRNLYEQRLMPLVFDAAPPSYDVAFDTFEYVANDLIASYTQ
jgi:predicted nucleotidyltransferase component of viral defense system